MRDGFIKIAAGTPKIRVADCRYNAEQIFNLMREAHRQGVRVLALPELCLTGYTCGDLFLQNTLLRGAEEGLATILEATKNLDMLTALGLPVHYRGKLYNCAAVLCRGEILGLAPKIHLPNYGEFYEGRWFTSGAALGDTDCCISFAGQDAVEFSTGLVFRCAEMPALTVGVEICEDLWAVNPPSARLCAEGATVMLNLSASNEVVGKSLRRQELVAGQSARLVCGYVYANAGEGESTTDLVFSGHNLIAENGTLLAERRFACGLTISELDVERLCYERRRLNTFPAAAEAVYPNYFSLDLATTALSRHVSPTPFVPENPARRAERCDEILKIAALGLKQRLEHAHARTAARLRWVQGYAAWVWGGLPLKSRSNQSGTGLGVRTAAKKAAICSAASGTAASSRRSRRALLSAAEGWGSDGRAMPLDEGMGSIRLTAPMTFPRPVPLERARKLVRKAMDR
jgi:NAD+ synthase (glutamine-hydrolysing)